MIETYSVLRFPPPTPDPSSLRLKRSEDDDIVPTRPRQGNPAETRRMRGDQSGSLPRWHRRSKWVGRIRRTALETRIVRLHTTPANFPYLAHAEAVHSTFQLRVNCPCKDQSITSNTQAFASSAARSVGIGLEPCLIRSPLLSEDGSTFGLSWRFVFPLSLPPSVTHSLQRARPALSAMSTKPRRTLAGPIFRVRTGCLTCRGRKKKCDETKPRCRGCERNRLECRWPPTSSSQATAAASSSQATQSGSTSRSPREVGNSPESTRQDDVQPTAPSPSGSTVASQSPQHLPDRSINFSFASHIQSSESPSAATTDSSPSPATQIVTTDQSGGIIIPPQTPEEHTTTAIGLQDPSAFSVFNTEDPDDGETADQMVHSPVQPMSIFRDHHVPRSMNLLAGNQDSNSLELLSHYLSATSLSMANGSTADNPFTAQLIPLAFSSDLVLQLLLTQSAVHRAAKSLVPTDHIATKYYNQSLRLFQQNISTYMGGQHGEETLILGIGALILCLVEVCRTITLAIEFTVILIPLVDCQR